MKLLYPTLAILLLASSSRAEQPAPPTKFFKLDFVLQELDGTKVINSREYSVTEGEGTPGSIRARAQVPTKTNTVDIGTNLDISQLHGTENGLTLTVGANITTLPLDPVPDSVFPMIRVNMWSGSVLIPLRKPVVLFSSDDVSSKHKLQLVLTATPVK